MHPKQSLSSIKAFSKIALAIFLLLSSLAVSSRATATEGTGTISGEVINRSTGTKVANWTVTLHTFSNEKETSTLVGQTNASGAFTFPNLSTSASDAYMVSTTYLDVTYQSQVAAFDQNSPQLTINLEVFETTRSQEQIKVNQAHLILYLGQGTMGVAKIIELENSGDRTVVGTDANLAGGKKATLGLSLPAGASNVRFFDRTINESFFVSEGRVVDTLPIVPGKSNLMLLYEVAYNPPSFQITKRLDYPTGSFRVLALDVGEKISSAQLKPREVLEAADGKYLHLAGEAFSQGTGITVDMTNIPQKIPASGAPASSQKVEQSVLYRVIAIGGGLALLAFGVVFLWQRRAEQRLAGARVTQKVVPSPSSEDMQTILEIAALDDSFAAGRITKEDYQRERAELKAKLKEELQNQRDQ